MLPKVIIVIKFRACKSNMQKVYKLSFHNFSLWGGLNSYVLLHRLENCLMRESSFPLVTVSIKWRMFLYHYVLYISSQRRINEVFLKHICVLRANVIKNPNSAFFQTGLVSSHCTPWELGKQGLGGHMSTGDAVWCGDNKRNQEQDKLKWNFRKHNLVYSANFPKPKAEVFQNSRLQLDKKKSKARCNKQLSLHREKGREI